jgi:hypothetical protein
MNRPEALPKIHPKCAALRLFAPGFVPFLVALGLLTACKPAAETQPTATEPEEDPVLLCGEHGRLSTELYGVVETQIEWNKNVLECTGMPRPEGRGVRLRFAGPAAAGELSLAIIIAIPDLVRDTENTEFSSNVTLIEEGNGRFFSTPDLNNCLTAVDSIEALDDSGDHFSIAGTLYCVSPLPEVNGDSSISIPELTFSGLLDWDAS